MEDGGWKIGTGRLRDKGRRNGFKGLVGWEVLWYVNAGWETGGWKLDLVRKVAASLTVFAPLGG